MLRSRSMGSREGWGQGNPSKVQDVEYIIDENGGTIPFPIRSQQKPDSLGYSTGREVSAIAATAKLQGDQMQQHMNTPIRPMDRAVFALVATATRQVGH